MVTQSLPQLLLPNARSEEAFVKIKNQEQHGEDGRGHTRAPAEHSSLGPQAPATGPWPMSAAQGFQGAGCVSQDSRKHGTLKIQTPNSMYRSIAYFYEFRDVIRACNISQGLFYSLQRVSHED